jgi:predicted site-specific integrase-resolvase
MEISELGEIFTCAEVARELQVTPGYVRHLARSGSLRALKTQSGQNIFMKIDVEQLKQKRSQILASTD